MSQTPDDTGTLAFFSKANIYLWLTAAAVDLHELFGSRAKQRETSNGVAASDSLCFLQKRLMTSTFQDERRAQNEAITPIRSTSPAASGDGLASFDCCDGNLADQSCRTKCLK